MYFMLTTDKYNHGVELLEQIKYSIDYDNKSIFNVIQSNLAAKLLQHEYAINLTEEQINILENIKNK